jgi:hypothetical protein
VHLLVDSLLLGLERLPHFADDAGDVGHLGLGVVLPHLLVDLLPVEEEGSQRLLGRLGRRTGAGLARLDDCRHWDSRLATGET